MLSIAQSTQEFNWRNRQWEVVGGKGTRTSQHCTQPKNEHCLGHVSGSQQSWRKDALRQRGEGGTLTWIEDKQRGLCGLPQSEAPAVSVCYLLLCRITARPVTMATSNKLENIWPDYWTTCNGVETWTYSPMSDDIVVPLYYILPRSLPYS